MESQRLRIKLLIDGGAKRVVLAEADKAFVDFLFRFLSLPIVTALGVPGQGARFGSLSNLRYSICNLNDCLLPKAKEAFLVSPADFSTAPEKVQKVFYGCSRYCNQHIAEDPTAICPICSSGMTMNVLLMEAPGAEGGSVKNMTYMVMDDLTISPMSITGLKKLNVKSIADLEEKIVYLGKDEAIKLLSASLHSKNVLTDVFLKDSNVPNGGSTSGVKRERTS